MRPKKKKTTRPTKSPARAPKRKAPRIRRNPDGLHEEIAQAARRFKGFRGYDAHQVTRMHIRPLPRAALHMGEVVGIMYRTFRDGRHSTFLHRFKKPARPALCVSSDGQQLLIVGGRYSVTDHGIVDTV